MNKLFFLILTFCAYEINGAIGCMAKMGCYNCVYCPCNCDQYPQLADRGMCMRCKHFRAPC